MKRRQADNTKLVSLPFIVGARALMRAAGDQHKGTGWIGLNALIFLLLPSFATGIAAALSWPSWDRCGGGKRQSV